MDFPVRILHEQLIAAGVPATGVNIGSTTDRSTWSVFFLPAATKAQKQQAADIITAFDVNTAQAAEQTALATTPLDVLIAKLSAKGILTAADVLALKGQ